MPGGRPPKYEPEMGERLLDMMSDGMSITEAAVELGVRRETIYAWNKDPRKPEFSNAFQEALERSQAWWERQGRTNLTTNGFQTGLWYANMKNRFGWADKQELTGKAGGPIETRDVKQLTNAQLAEIAAKAADGDE